MGSSGAIDWTAILVALIAAVPATIAAVVALLNRRSLRTPSGDSIGAVAERAEHMTNAGVALTRHTLAHASGDHELADRLTMKAILRNGEALPAPLEDD